MNSITTRQMGPKLMETAYLSKAANHVGQNSQNVHPKRAWVENFRPSPGLYHSVSIGHV